MFLILIDSQIEVMITTGSTSAIVTQALRTWFAQFGLPEIVVTDNGPGFASEEFEVFLHNNGIKHINIVCPISSIIYWISRASSANSQERFEEKHRRFSNNQTRQNFVRIQDNASVDNRSISCTTVAWSTTSHTSSFVTT